MSEPAWDQFAIKAEIHRRGMTLTQLAKNNGFNPNRLRAVWSRTDRRAEAIIHGFIAEEKNVTLEDLWPDRYPITSHRIYDIRKHGPSTSQKQSVSADKVAAA